MKASVLLLCLGLAGCSDGGSCGEPVPPRGFVSGTYSCPGGEVDLCEHCAGVALPPHDGVTDLEMTLDAEANTVTLRYDRAGVAVVEHWNMVDRRYR